MAVNPYGAVQLSDFGQPKVVTMLAYNTISGGQFVTGSGASGVISSGTDSFASSDLTCYLNGSGTSVTGIALGTAVSGGYLPVALEGIFILQSRGTVTAGNVQGAAGDDSVTDAGVAGTAIGRSLTTASSGAFAVVACKFF